MGLFVRKVKTASGATAVQIAEKRRGVRTIIEHLGSAHTEAEVAALVQVAKDRIAGDQQQLDLQIPVPTDKPAPSAAPAGPVVTGSSSKLLWDVLEQAYSRIGFEGIGNETFKQLVLARLVDPTSKADTIRVLEEIGAQPPSLRTIWRTLAACIEQDWRDGFCRAAYAFAAAKAGPTGLSVVLYDVTTLYFEATDEDELRKVGMSKERRVDPQIVVGLLVDSAGFPLEIHCFEGNKAETLTLIPVLKSFQGRHGTRDLVVVADAGMLSAANLNALEDAGFSFIVGSRITKAPYDLAAHFERHGNHFTDGQTLESVRSMGTGAKARDRRVVYHYSFKREKRDNYTLNKQIEKAEKVANGQRPLKRDRFVKLAGKKPGVDWTLVERARQLLGLKGYVSNIGPEILDGPAVVAAYHSLWQVEKSFRMAKSDIRARPMFHHQRDSIEAHLTVVFCALAVARHLQDVTGISIKKLVQTLRPLRTVTIDVNGHDLTAAPAIDADIQKILDMVSAHAGH
ncbi:IS1634 family transposase [Citricoccus sp. NPDC055426]|uniref:IS1634 family transposase n=1 Tax=Citricoccus sp. NPDC055426 TaxID=3155536 RepID=UPI00342083A6